jgi:hypothetical protein
LALALNPSGDQTLPNPADQTPALPATIPEHSSVSDGSNAVSTSAAVAAAFAADAAAVHGLVEAAAAAPPAPKPNHSRSKSAVPLTTAPELPASPTHHGVGLQDASVHSTETASLPPTALLAEVTPATPVSSSSSTVQLPAGRVTRALSVSSSPFAQVDLQQAVTATLLTQQPPRTPPYDSTPADLAAASDATAAAAAAAHVSRHAGSTPTSKASNSSSSYRGLAALQHVQYQQQQQALQGPVPSAPLYTPPCLAPAAPACAPHLPANLAGRHLSLE